MVLVMVLLFTKNETKWTRPLLPHFASHPTPRSRPSAPAHLFKPIPPPHVVSLSVDLCQMFSFLPSLLEGPPHSSLRRRGLDAKLRVVAGVGSPNPQACALWPPHCPSIQILRTPTARVALGGGIHLSVLENHDQKSKMSEPQSS